MTASVQPDTPSGRAPADSPAAQAVAAPAVRNRLFTKYDALLVAVVGVTLLSGGIFEVFTHYREHRASLIRIQHEQAKAAAAKISQFIEDIEGQLGWTTQLPWSANAPENRRFDALRLLRQVPAITELVLVDAAGKERLRVSRLTMDVVEQVKVGEHGHAYVGSARGRLIAHQDMGLVLRNTDMSKLAQVQAAQADADVTSDALEDAQNILGQDVLTAFAPIQPLRWTMFVERPVEEAYASLYAALQRLAIVLAAALVLSTLVGMLLTRRVVGPIEALRAGADALGGGDLARRIAIGVGGDSEGLSNRFGDMDGRARDSRADPENHIERSAAQSSESLQREITAS